MDMQPLQDIQLTSNDGKKLKPLLIDFFQSFEFKMQELFTDMKNEFQLICQQNTERIERLEGEVTSLQKKIKKLEEKGEKNEAYSGRDCIILSGPGLPKGSSSENCCQVALNALKSKINITVDPKDVSVAHRLGKPPTDSNEDSRKIIVKLCRRDLKSDIMGAAKAMKPSNFFVNESLTPQSQTISFVLRKARKDFPNLVSGSSTQDGVNYVWLKPTNAQASGARNVRHKISTHTSLVSFCSQTLKKPLSHYVPVWKH